MAWELKSLAFYLSQGKHIAMGRLALATLYRGLGFSSVAMCVPISGVFHGPFWILQVWVKLYFLSLFSDAKIPLPQGSQVEPFYPESKGAQLLSFRLHPSPEGSSSFQHFLHWFYHHSLNTDDFCHSPARILFLFFILAGLRIAKNSGILL